MRCRSRRPAAPVDLFAGPPPYLSLFEYAASDPGLLTTMPKVYGFVLGSLAPII